VREQWQQGHTRAVGGGGGEGENDGRDASGEEGAGEKSIGRRASIDVDDDHDGVSMEVSDSQIP
jgi:hypothetical protein